MDPKTKSLGDAARALSAADRLALVEDILASLDHTDPEIDRLWKEEGEARLAAYERGQMNSRSAREVLAKYRNP